MDNKVLPDPSHACMERGNWLVFPQRPLPQRLYNECCNNAEKCMPISGNTVV